MRVSYPIRLTYVNSLTAWWPASKIAAGLAVPSYASNNIYNYVALGLWGYNGPMDVGLVWQSPVHYFGTEFGNSNSEAQKFLKKKYNDAGMKILIRAFGMSQFPTQRDPLDVATRLAKFVTDNNFDGCVIDYQDNASMQTGTA